MKTITLTGLIIFLNSLLFAQDEKNLSFTPTKNNFTFEVNFTPFNPDSPIDINGFSSRLFLSDKMALRLGFNVDHKKIFTEMPYETNDGAVYYESIDEKYNVLGINAGIEYHFLNSKRVTPYVGVSLGFEDKTSESKYEDVEYDYNGMQLNYHVVTTEIKNLWREFILQYDPNNGYYYVVTNYQERGYHKFYGLAVLGADVYIVRHFYMGVEIGLGMEVLSYKEVELKIDDDPEPNIPKATESSFGLNVNNAIRLGFWF